MGYDYSRIDRIAEALSTTHSAITSDNDHLIIGETSLTPEEAKYLTDRLFDIMEDHQKDLLEIYSSIRGNLGDGREWKVVSSRITKYCTSLIDEVIEKTEGDEKKKYLRKKGDILLGKSSVKKGLASAPETGSTALHIAAATGDLSIVKEVKEIFKNGIRDIVDQPNNLGLMPLVLAVFYNQFELAEMLIREGANIDATNPDINTILHLMIITKKIDGIRFCLDKGCATYKKNGFERGDLHMAVISGDREILELFLERTGYQDHLEDRDLFGRTPLDLAYEEKNDEAIELLGGDLSSPLYGQKRVGINQRKINKKFNDYLSLKGRENFLNVEGNCNGFSFLFQYYNRSGKLDEFFQILELIASWDGTEEGLLSDARVKGLSGNYKNLEEVIEQWINDALYFQHSMAALGSGDRQDERMQQFEFVKKDEQIQVDVISTWDNLYTPDQLTEQLRFYSYFPNLTVEMSLPSHKVVCCILPGGKMRYYDPNIEYPIEPFEAIEGASSAIQNITYPILSKKKWDEVGVKFLAYYLHGDSLDDTVNSAPTKVPEEMLEASSPNGWTKLHLAVLFNDEELFTKLLSDDKIDIQVQDAHGYTPLRFAVEMGRVDMAKQLLADPRTDVNYESHGENLLSSAVQGGYLSITNLLMSCKNVGSLVDNAFTVALQKKDMAVIKAILDSEHKVDLDVFRLLSTIETPLQYALLKKNLEMITLLLQHGADPLHNYRDEESPLSMIADIRDESMLREIIPLLGDLQKKDKSGKTLAEHAKEKENTELQKLLELN